MLSTQLSQLSWLSLFLSDQTVLSELLYLLPASAKLQEALFLHPLSLSLLYLLLPDLSDFQELSAQPRMQLQMQLFLFHLQMRLIQLCLHCLILLPILLYQLRLISPE